jgi:hypothetical protein
MADNPLNLDSPREWYGMWWIPNEPETKVPGVLRYNLDNGLVLSLIEDFENKILVFQSNSSLPYHSLLASCRDDQDLIMESGFLFQ